MNRKSEKTEYGVLQSHNTLLDFSIRVLDALVISLVFCLVYPLETFSVGKNAISNIAVNVLLFSLFSALFGVYRSRRIESPSKEMGEIAMSMLLAFASGYWILHFSGRLISDSKTFALWFSLTVLLLISLRFALRLLLSWARRRGHNTRTVLLVGGGKLGDMVLSKLEQTPWLGLRVCKVYDDNGDCLLAKKAGPLFVQGVENVFDDARSGYDMVILALPMRSEEKIKHLIEGLKDSTATTLYVPNIFMFDLLNARQMNIAGIPAISIFDTPFDSGNALVKRLFDIFFSLAALCFCAIPMLIIAACIKLESKGPAFFKQVRYGVDGKRILVWKFRSMRVMENSAEVKQATKNDPRVTKVGAFIRKTSLDELPQFINVLQGSMSVVGPRPHAEAHNELYRKQIPGYMLRHKVKPGITGWAQVNGWRGETDTLEKMEKRIEFDIDYIRRWSFWLDIKIIFKTIFKGFSGENAY